MYERIFSRFNSTLVRLKGAVRHVDDLRLRFQFHTGSIKSEAISSAYMKDKTVSIPHWFD